MDDSLILGLMAKFWTSGQAKTRLGASIGMSAAASIHQLFTSHLCRNLCHCADRRQLCITPQERRPEFQAALAAEKLLDFWSIVPQGEGDLGQRMSDWFAENLAASHSHAILIGADCPTLVEEDVQQADDLLTKHDVVIGPAQDGGYYLIGLRGPWHSRFASLFLNVPWSGPEVCQITCARVVQAGLSLGQLPTGEDVDTIVELNRLRQRLREKDASNRHVNLQNQIESILDRSTPPTSEPCG